MNEDDIMDARLIAHFDQAIAELEEIPGGEEDAALLREILVGTLALIEEREGGGPALNGGH
jgi:hypothetical protein